MLTSQGQTRNPKHRSPMFIWVLLPLAMLASFMVVGRGTQESVQLSVDDPRPVAKAIRMLEANCGCVITYEDPRYTHASEIKDVTEEVRRDLDRYEPGKAPRVMGPKGGVLVVDYVTVAGTKRPMNTTLVLQQLLDAHERQSGAGKFRLEQNGRLIHVIPVAAKNASGDLAFQQSVLDVAISLPAQERSGAQTLKAICDAISKENKVSVMVGTIPLNMFLRYHSAQGVAEGKARDVLVGFLHGVDNGDRLSWRLLYDPGMKTYALNIHRVP